MSRRILVTGSTRGLGRAVAQHYLAQGDDVFGCGRGAATIDHERYTHFCVDLSQMDAVEQLLIEVRRSARGLDVLINNAGAASMNVVALTPISTVRRVLDTNFVSAVALMHAAIRLLRRSTSGRIVNVTSIAVPLRLEGEAAYAASKSALETFTRVLAKEVGPMGITCNAVGPSVIRTRLTEGVSEEKLQRLLRAQAVPIEATPADVTNVIDFFLRPESRLITGQIVYLGGYG